MKKLLNQNKLLIVLAFCLPVAPAFAQTDIDAIMMEKNAFCVGPMYGYSSWKNYWEGTRKRENLNLGKVSSNMYSLMGAYGVSRNLNLLFNASYVKNKASAGTLHSMKGLQDLSLFVKWRALSRKLGNGKFTLFGIGAVSFPLTDYVADYLPLAIGSRSTTLSARVMGDFQQGIVFVTGSATYAYRNNIKIDRDSYYTTELHQSNEVEMPDGANFNLRAGIRNNRWIAEVVANNWTTLGGFDITRNNMPFPSNRMNATSVGVNVKYVLPSIPQLSIVAGGHTTVAGRNVGQSTGFYGSIFYVFDLGRKTSSTVNPNKN